MHHDFSWERAATAYAEIYERALDDRRIRTGQ
jgi:glycogen synthase